MKEDKDILTRIGHRDGMTVPEGYFADFAARMAESLEKTPFEESNIVALKPRSFWQKVRPYVYMAAMFAGVWCMLKVFTSFTMTSDNALSPTMAEALGNDVFVNEYIIDDVDQWDLMDDLMENGVEVTDLTQEFADEDTSDTNQIEI